MKAVYLVKIKKKVVKPTNILLFIHKIEKKDVQTNDVL